MSAVDLYKANLDVLLGVDSPTSITATYDPAGLASILYGVFDDVKFQSTKSDPSGNAMTKNSYIIFSISTAPDFDIYDNKILQIGTTNYTIKYKDFDATGIQRLWRELEFEFDTKGLYELNVIKNLMRLFPDMRGDLLGFLGNAGRNKLRKEHLTGQDLTLRAREKDKLGRRTVNYSVDRQATRATITSYPVNLFEKGYTLHGHKMPARNIITGKFKTTMSANLQNYINAWENINLKKFLKEAEK